MIGYGQLEPASLAFSIGFHLSITSSNSSGFNYTLVTYDVTTVLLHYLYLAIQYETNSFYTAAYSYSCNTYNN
jgi:hypothetical protein